MQLFVALARATLQRMDGFKNFLRSEKDSWCMKRILKYDREAEEALQNSDANAKTKVNQPRYVRINLLRTTIDSMITSFKQESFVLKPTPEKYEDYIQAV